MAIDVVETTGSYILTIIIGVVILLIFFGIGILAKKLLSRLLKEIGLNTIFGKVGVTTDLEKWISSVVSYLFYFIGLVLFLDQLKIRSIVIYIILGAILMLLTLTLIVGLKDVIPNFIGWIYLQRKGMITAGKHIAIKEIAGEVEHVGYLETEIRTDKDDLLYVPNSLFLKSKFKIKKDLI
ncbi:MAG: Potassium efflux system KefA protein / Small-conductance mechanosensitive channel [archaeon GW2011_AR9]|nr:MAG: Potassium efflux system KefA protein / Small-conductance mechanosensitive channel [archaeon GW2011_AR9]MBS3120361.1 mechanosensitive ion channel [Candidatus Woesearchaeota archaeon]HIG93182.1 mechanosensitive ion channel [Candidatus Woesearchaeota archaeon]HIH13171.1 mechanosensitive ion channel [Candidatus Woesearchaeota archaeon]